MFGWLKGRSHVRELEVENQRLNAQVEAVKALSLRDVVSAAGGMDGNMRPVVRNAAEQLEHFRGWVFAAVRLTAVRIAGQSIHVARKPSRPAGSKATGEKLEPLDAHPLLDALADPSNLHTAWSLMFVTVASLELTGRALWWVTKDQGRPSIFHIPTKWIESVDARRTTWKIRPAGATESFPLPGSEVVHFCYPDPADPLGCLSPLARIAEAVVSDESIQAAQRHAFKNALRPGLALIAGRLPDTPTGQKGERPIFEPHQRLELIEAIKRVHQGVVNAGEPLILDGLIEDVKPIFKTIAEVDFLDSSKLAKARILQGFGVSPILLGEVEGANRASATVADEIFTANKVNPLCELLSQSMTEWLGPNFARPNEKLFVWIEPAVAHDPEMQLKRWELGLKMGAASRNEYRTRILNLPELEGLSEVLEPAMFVPRPAGKSLDILRGTNPYNLERMNGHAH